MRTESCSPLICSQPWWQLHSALAPNTVLNHLQWFTTPFCHQGKLAWPNNCPATLFESMNKCQFSCQHMCSEIFWLCECQEAKQCHFCPYLLLNTNSWSATESKVQWMVWYLGKGELGQYFNYFTNHFIKIQKLYHVILIGFMIEGSETHVIHIKALFKVKKAKIPTMSKVRGMESMYLE